MRKFIAKHQATGMKITFAYDIDETLRIVELEGDWKPEQVQKTLSKIPVTTEQILADIKNQKANSTWIFAEATDTSFKSFYGRYPNKKGPKEVTEKAWNKLSETDKISAILFIPVLINQKGDGTAFPYPSTYLNKKYWR